MLSIMNAMLMAYTNTNTNTDDDADDDAVNDDDVNRSVDALEIFLKTIT